MFKQKIKLFSIIDFFLYCKLFQIEKKIAKIQLIFSKKFKRY
jgi:hypothetical protein